MSSSWTSDVLSPRGDPTVQDLGIASDPLVPEIDELQAIVPLWKELSSQLHPAEVDEVKRVIGITLVDDNTTLFNELVALIDILKDLRSETDQLEKRNTFLRKSFPTPPSLDLLQREIRMLVDAMRKKGRTEEEVKGMSKSDKALLQYIMNPAPPQRPTTPRPSSSHSDSRDNRSPRPMDSNRSMPNMTPRPASSASSARPGSALSHSQADLSRVNVFEIDAVVGHLREAFETEKLIVQEDIDFIRNCIEAEADYHAQAKTFRPPSVQEVRAINTKLQEALADEQRREEQERLLNAVPTQTRKDTAFSRHKGLPLPSVPPLSSSLKRLPLGDSSALPPRPPPSRIPPSASAPIGDLDDDQPLPSHSVHLSKTEGSSLEAHTFSFSHAPPPAHDDDDLLDDFEKELLQSISPKQSPHPTPPPAVSALEQHVASLKPPRPNSGGSLSTSVIAPSHVGGEKKHEGSTRPASGDKIRSPSPSAASTASALPPRSSSAGEKSAPRQRRLSDPAPTAVPAAKPTATTTEDSKRTHVSVQPKASPVRVQTFSMDGVPPPPAPAARSTHPPTVSKISLKFAGGDSDGESSDKRSSGSAASKLRTKVLSARGEPTI